jgi:hypothetical protein
MSGLHCVCGGGGGIVNYLMPVSNELLWSESSRPPYEGCHGVLFIVDRWRPYLRGGEVVTSGWSHQSALPSSWVILWSLRSHHCTLEHVASAL